MRASEFITEHQLVWARKKGSNAPVMKWRCTNGPRKGRVVPTPGDCSSAPDLAARERMKKTRAKTKIMQARRAKKTKRVNPTSRLVRRLNKKR